MTLHMANCCDNTFYAYTEDERNREWIHKFFTENWIADPIDDIGNEMEGYFESKWNFPEELMRELYDKMPNKEDIYMRCLSVEYGCLYHALWVCDEDGWEEV